MISRLYPTSADPQFGRFNYQLAEALRKRCRLTVVAPTPHRLPAGDDYGARHPRYFSIPFVNRLMAGHTVRHCLRGLTGDVALATFAWPDGFAATQLDLPVVIKAGGSDIDALPAAGVRRRQTLAALRACRKIYVVASHLRDTMVRMGIASEKISVIHNGIDPGKFRVFDRQQARRQLSLPDNGKIILYVGWIETDKGIEYLLRGFARLAGTTLVLVGRGVDEGAMQELARELGIAARCRFVGAQPHDTIPIWMNAADVLAFPSLHEGCPNVVLEALACGLPVAATNVGGIPEITPQAPWCRLVPPRDAAALADALTQLLALDYRRDEIAQTSRRTWDDVAGDVYNLLTHV